MPIVEKTGSGSPLIIWGIGDSRMRGAGCTVPATKNWLSGVLGSRLPPYFQVTNAGVDGLRQFDTSGDSTKVAATTAQAQAVIGSASRSAIINQLDINDWSANFTAATYGAALAAQLDSWHLAIPTATVIVYTSLDYSTYGTANTSGSTMLDYVTQQTNIVSARSSYAQLVLGKPMLTWVASPAPSATQPQGFDDTKHPNDIGNVIIANDYMPLIQSWFQ